MSQPFRFGKFKNKYNVLKVLCYANPTYTDFLTFMHGLTRSSREALTEYAVRYAHKKYQGRGPRKLRKIKIREAQVDSSQEYNLEAYQATNLDLYEDLEVEITENGIQLYQAF